MTNRNPQQLNHGRLGTISNAAEAVMRITAPFARTENLTRRPFLSSATTASIATARQARQLPLKSFRECLWWLRKLCFTRPRSLEPSIIVSESKETVLDLFSQSGFTPAWTVSYNYRGEILNLRRIERFAHSSGLDWWQVHIRGYDHADDIELTAHFEPEPRRHPHAHINLFGLDINRGMDTLLELLNRQRINYDWLDGPVTP
jgi:hypothetical protein